MTVLYIWIILLTLLNCVELVFIYKFVKNLNTDNIAKLKKSVDELSSFISGGIFRM